MSLARAGVSLHARAAEAVSALPPDLAPDSQIAHGQKWGAIAERWGSKGKRAGWAAHGVWRLETGCVNADYRAHKLERYQEVW